MGRPIKKGSTDQSTVIRILDSTTFLPETAVEHNTAGIDLWYRREQEVKVAITEAALAALDSAHADGGIEHIGDGYYRLDLPDAAVAAGAGENSVQIGGTVTGMIVIGNEHALVDYDPYDAINMGMSALPNAAANAAGGMPTSAAGGLNLDTIGSDTAAILVDTDTMEADLTTEINANETKIDAVKADTAAILIDTDTMEADLVTALPDAAAINAQVLDVMNVDTFAEPGQVNPPAAPTIRQMLHHPYKKWRNKRDQNGATKQFYNSAGAVVDQKRTVSDNGVTYEETIVASGP